MKPHLCEQCYEIDVRCYSSTNGEWHTIDESDIVREYNTEMVLESVTEVKNLKSNRPHMMNYAHDWMVNNYKLQRCNYVEDHLVDDGIEGDQRTYLSMDPQRACNILPNMLGKIYETESPQMAMTVDRDTIVYMLGDFFDFFGIECCSYITGDKILDEFIKRSPYPIDFEGKDAVCYINNGEMLDSWYRTCNLRIYFDASCM